MFMGEYNHTIDAKGRLIIPSKFRELLGEEFVLTRGLDGCLYIYPMDEWESFEMKLRSLPLTNKNARTFSRFFVAGATTCELDRQGRILVPQTLREFAGLEKDVVLTGNLNRIEVWSKEKWNEICDYDDMDSSSVPPVSSTAICFVTRNRAMVIPDMERTSSIATRPNSRFTERF